MARGSMEPMKERLMKPELVGYVSTLLEVESESFFRPFCDLRFAL